MEEKLVSIAEAAEIVAVHPETLRRLVKQGVVPALRIGKSWRIRLSDLEPSLHGPGSITQKPREPQGRFAKIARGFAGSASRTPAG